MMIITMAIGKNLKAIKDDGKEELWQWERELKSVIKDDVNEEWW